MKLHNSRAVVWGECLMPYALFRMAALKDGVATQRPLLASPLRAYAGTGVERDRPAPGALATDVDSGRMTTGSQAHDVSLQIQEGLHCFMLRQQRAAWASLQGHILKPELMTYAQGQNQPI